MSSWKLWTAAVLVASTLWCPAGAETLEKVGGNPHNAPWLTESMVRSLESVQRIDEEGLLYYMECEGDSYRDSEILKILGNSSSYEAGCSSFVVQNTSGETLTCRNYDFKHLTADKKPTGMNIVVRCSPRGKYRSLGLADGYWLDIAGSVYTQGQLDDGKTDISALMVLPYVIMDGLNEKGVTVSVLRVDTRPGEREATKRDPNKPSASHSVLMRLILDNCATVDEAITLARSHNLVEIGNSPCHIFVTDSSGAGVVLEWRNDKLYAVRTNAVTNFYMCSDDGEDYYRKGVLREKFVRLTNTLRDYHYGYGHGYHRFTGIVSALERYVKPLSGNLNAVMTDDQARDILRVAAQDVGTEATSLTQYSVIYNSAAKTAQVWVHQNYRRQYLFKL